MFATAGTVVPRALGGNLGCGIAATRLSLGINVLDRRTLERTVAAFGCAIPAGDATHRGAGVVVPDALQSAELSTQALLRTRDALSKKHLATLAVIAELLGTEVVAEEHLDVHHNFVAREVWDGEELLVHRKGAVHVPRGARALVPGSMATASYLVEGLGCALAFDSCSHGAGRVLTRTEARARIRPEALARAMRRVVWPERLARRLVEEAPAAYRDLGEVLEDQEDLVQRERRLEPIAVLKG